MDVKYFVYIVLILHRNLSPVVGAEGADIYRMTDSIFTCSKWLSSIIDNFCNNVFKIVKRDTSVMLGKLTPTGLQRSANKKRLLAEKRLLRVRRQVARECCERPCTVSTIIMYCPDDARLLQENPDIFY
ncbi:uncharacterized protein LOC119838351 [Zerene cesonia]|uniref:uncharacterized protein LOC119838351 n=1 Tax=Zerene cesonia TaxID=33412 RepID=UPI0018E5A252|nr:uncharacterized protein LOC119838351 [Zerene cesonia]